MQYVALIDYGSGNLHSAQKALVRAATERGVDAAIHVTSDPKVIATADRIVLPGVGAFGACMAALNERPGLAEAIDRHIRDAQRPFLGICVGMQLLAERGVEYGEHKGLGFLPGTVRLLEAKGQKLPHIGWNTVEGAGHPLLPPDGDAYFVHSYCFDATQANDVAATATYGERFTAMVARDNVAGTQFHPEKSQAFGLALLGNFLEWSV